LKKHGRLNYQVGQEKPYMNLLLISQIKLETKMTMRRWAHKGDEKDNTYKQVIKSILLGFLTINKYSVSKSGLSRMQMDIQDFFDDFIIYEEIVDIPLLKSNDYEKWSKASRNRKVKVHLELSKQVFMVHTFSDYELETFYKR